LAKYKITSYILLPNKKAHYKLYPWQQTCDTQENGSNAVEGDTEDGSSLTNRHQVGSNDTQGTNATPTVDEPGSNDTPVTF
jgi:hypothetical protein